MAEEDRTTKLTRSQLVEMVAQRTKVPQVKVRAVIDEAVDTIVGVLLSGGRVTLPSFGTFHVKHRNPLRYYASDSGTWRQAAGGPTVYFRPARSLKVAVRQPNDVRRA